MKRTTARVIGAGAGVLVGAGIMVAVVNLASSGEVEVRLGDDLFTVGDAGVLAAAIRRDDQPLLFQDLLTDGDRDIWVQHLGDDPLEGWVAFAARRPGQPRACTLEWRAAEELFVDPCDGTEVAADGDGLPAYPVTIDDDDRVVVDLLADQRATTTTRRP